MQASPSTMEKNIFRTWPAMVMCGIAEAGQQRDSICLSYRRANQEQMWLVRRRLLLDLLFLYCPHEIDQNIEGARSGNFHYLCALSKVHQLFTEVEEALNPLQGRQRRDCTDEDFRLFLRVSLHVVSLNMIYAWADLVNGCSFNQSVHVVNLLHIFAWRYNVYKAAFERKHIIIIRFKQIFVTTKYRFQGRNGNNLR